MKENKGQATAAVQIQQLKDENIVLEDETKFQDYFLKQKRKTVVSPTCQDFELSVNRELIEQSQEAIIEQEEVVPEYPTPTEAFVIPVKARQSTTSEEASKKEECASLLITNQKPLLGGGWFSRVGSNPVGLKGGADREYVRHCLFLELILCISFVSDGNRRPS